MAAAGHVAWIRSAQLTGTEEQTCKLGIFLSVVTMAAALGDELGALEARSGALVAGSTRQDGG